MHAQEAKVLVLPFSKAGEAFVQKLSELKQDFTVVTRISEGGKEFVPLLNSGGFDHNDGNAASLQLWSEWTRIYIFEEDLETCCKVLKMIGTFRNSSIFVITSKHYPSMIYRSLGANYVIRSQSDDLSFLLEGNKREDQINDGPVYDPNFTADFSLAGRVYGLGFDSSR